MMGDPAPPTPRMGLYVHVPYCQTKCGYCDFYSIPLKDKSTTLLTTALVEELELRCGRFKSQFATIFIGGGTPTVLPLPDMKRLFECIAELCTLKRVEEFTTEANPATVDSQRLDCLLACGVNRISLGGQSFHEEDLKVLERLHDPRDIGISIRLARAAGVAQINLDLIFGIPGQSMQRWMETMKRAVELETDHLSCYALTYEPRTPLLAQMQQGLIEPCDHDLEADMYLACIDYLQEQGFMQYEISNFSRPGKECKHNLIYWSNQPYIGIGPSAAGYIGGTRYKNVAHIEAYTRRVLAGESPVESQETLTGLEHAGETLMLQLRMNRGIDIRTFTQQTGYDPIQIYQEPLTRYAAQGLVEYDPERIRLTRSGRLLANSIIADFMEAARAVR